MRSPPALPLWQRGFTLIEIVIALVLLGILGIAGSKVFTASVYTNQTISASNMAYASARYAIERVSRETREMDKTASIAASRLTLSASTLVFIKSGPQGQQTVTFTFGNDGTLRMAYGTGASHVLATNLIGGSFSYYTSVDAASVTPALGNASDPFYVFIRLQVKPDPALTQVFTLSNLIYLRNS